MIRTKSRAAFVDLYCLLSGISIEALQADDRVAARCDCGTDDCRGWQMLPRDLAKWMQEQHMLPPGELGL